MDWVFIIFYVLCVVCFDCLWFLVDDEIFGFVNLGVKGLGFYGEF